MWRGSVLVRDGRVDVAAFWGHLDRPLAHSADGSVWSLGEGAAERAASLRSLEAPDFSLPLVTEAGMVSLKDYLGRTPVLLVLLRYIW